jgi:uncharacterized protein
MFARLLPQEHDFFDMFEAAADHAVEAAQLLLKLTQNYHDADLLAHELHALEHACDDIAHQAIAKLNTTFITPFDREDIHEMILKLDDVVDLINASGKRLALYNIGQPTPHAINLAKQIVRGCERLAAAVRHLRSTKLYDQLAKHCIEVHETENAGDDILQTAMGDLFRDEKDPIQVIKWKDIYETMEMVTDRCEDVANVMQGVIVKMT